MPSISDLSTSLASMASDLKAEQFSEQLGIAILKNTLDQQKTFGEALVNMINQTPSPDGAGRIVDMSA